MKWRKSRRCGHGCEDCVEIAGDGQMIYLRDSKNPKPIITLSPKQFLGFITTIKGV